METPTIPAPDPEAIRRLVAMVGRIEAGDALAEAELVAHFSPGLRVILRRLAGDAALADDLHQETLAVVLRKIRARELRQPESLAAFIRATARNLFIADRRKEARYVELGEEPAADPGLPAAFSSAGGHPLHRLEAQEEALLVRRLLGELRHPRDRELLVRVYLREEEKETVCRELGLDPGHYNQLLFRARQRLRELWEKNDKRRRFFSSAADLERKSRDDFRGGDTSRMGGNTE